MPAVILLEFRPLRYLLLVLVVGVLRGAANGDWQALVILSVCALLLWWRDLLDAARDVREKLYQAHLWLEWAWGRLLGQLLPGPRCRVRPVQGGQRLDPCGNVGWHGTFASGPTLHRCLRASRPPCKLMSRPANHGQAGEQAVR